MKVSLHKSRIEGRVKAPPSKSYTIRGLMCAALAGGESRIVNPLTADDTEAALSVLGKLGISVQRESDLWQVAGGNFHEPDGNLFCGDSAATLRFMTAICSLVPGRCKLTAGSSLSKRPVEPLVQALKQLGVKCSSTNGLPPVIVEGGKLKGGVAELPGDISSQFVSALLFISPLAEAGMKIRLTTPAESKPYILMTLECLKTFGIGVNASADLREFEAPRQAYRPARYMVEGDWSSASYFLALGAVSGKVKVENLNPQSLQGDRVLADLLRRMGARVEVNDNAVTVSKAALNALRADLSDCIDLLPTLAVLAAAARGVSQLTGIARARIKESNRVSALREGLQKMGIKVEEEQDKLTITGSQPKGAVIDPHGDHRMAMSFSVLGSLAGNTVINDAECVSKTFPQFWNELKSIGGEVKIHG